MGAWALGTLLMYGTLFTFYSLNRYYTGREVGCQVNFLFWTRINTDLHGLAGAQRTRREGKSEKGESDKSIRHKSTRG